MHASSPSHFHTHFPIKLHVCYFKTVSVQRSQKPVNRKQLTELKDPSVLDFLDHAVCVCFIWCVCCFELTCRTGVNTPMTLPAATPSAAAAVVGILVAADARRKKGKKRKEHWRSTLLIFHSRSHLNVV